MNKIYVLKYKECDYFGDGKEWVIASWTDDPRIAGKWRNSSHLDMKKDFDYIERAPNNEEKT